MRVAGNLSCALFMSIESCACMCDRPVVQQDENVLQTRFAVSLLSQHNEKLKSNVFPIIGTLFERLCKFCEDSDGHVRNDKAISLRRGSQLLN